MCCNAVNAIGDEGAIRIAEGLDKNTSVKELYIGGVFPLHIHSSFIVASLTLSSPKSILFDVKDELTLSHIYVINVE